MLRKTLTAVAVTASLAGALTACGGGSTTGANGQPVVKIRVGGRDKQIYLPFTLAKQLGYYQKYGMDVQLSDEVDGGVGAEDAMASGQASAYCQSLGGGFRVPSANELVSLVDFSKSTNPAIDRDAFPDTPVDIFWTSTSASGTPAKTVVVGFASYGAVFRMASAATGHVRCVR